MSHPSPPFRQPGLWLASVVLCLAGLAWASPSVLPLPDTPRPAAEPAPTPRPEFAHASSVVQLPGPDIGDVLAVVRLKPGREYDRWPDYAQESVSACMRRYAPDGVPAFWQISVTTSEQRAVSADINGTYNEAVKDCIVRHMQWGTFDLDDGTHRSAGMASP